MKFITLVSATKVPQLWTRGTTLLPHPQILYQWIQVQLVGKTYLKTILKRSKCKAKIQGQQAPRCWTVVSVPAQHSVNVFVHCAPCLGPECVQLVQTGSCHPLDGCLDRGQCTYGFCDWAPTPLVISRVFLTPMSDGYQGELRLISSKGDMSWNSLYNGTENYVQSPFIRKKKKHRSENTRILSRGFIFKECLAFIGIFTK